MISSIHSSYGLNESKTLEESLWRDAKHYTVAKRLEHLLDGFGLRAVVLSLALEFFLFPEIFLDFHLVIRLPTKILLG